ncbi:hypothetical protein CPLU01_11510 [Colletotrichum plurivorum]|uniref:Uncharacterized protein n=1 Tax=Colletotrichum plurivorum TaxID=2175906 RepID=A0A8H6N8G7_9PEZI|nr:hypothetical protein CPLU01_11510 [Colletotrichum plurivorum]
MSRQAANGKKVRETPSLDLGLDLGASKMPGQFPKTPVKNKEVSWPEDLKAASKAVAPVASPTTAEKVDGLLLWKTQVDRRLEEID